MRGALRMQQAPAERSRDFRGSVGRLLRRLTPQRGLTLTVVVLAVLGIEPSKTNWVRVATIINEGLPDLIRMPHAPEKELEKAAIGSMKLREDGRLVAAQDIHLETEGAATYA